MLSDSTFMGLLVAYLFSTYRFVTLIPVVYVVPRTPKPKALETKSTWEEYYSSFLITSFLKI